MGVGIGTGPAFVGNIQSSDRLIWTVIGDTVNRAARLQSMTRDLNAAVAIDDTTFRAPVGRRARRSCAMRILQFAAAQPETVHALAL